MPDQKVSENPEIFVTFSKMVSGMAVALVILTGWIFSLVVETSSNMKGQLAGQAERIAKTEVHVENIIYRLDLRSTDADKKFDEINDRISRAEERAMTDREEGLLDKLAEKESK